VFEPDLIMMGKHGTHAAEDLLLGSVTKKVLEITQTDVFVMVDKRQPGFSG
jgi:nucleotide-binding universal stress UspA family protein